jgi:hypothetical protein
MEIIKKDLWQQALRIQAEQAQQPQGHLVVNLTKEDSRRRKREKVWCEHCSRFVTTHTAHSCWNKPGNPDPRRDRARLDNVPSSKEDSESCAQERQTNNESMWFPSLNSSVEPWNACAHNMELINHDLKDNWILDSGATNHMTGNPELMDGTSCLVHQSPYILITTRNWWQRESAHSSRPRCQSRFK